MTYVLSWKNQVSTYSPNAYSSVGGTQVDVNFGSCPSGTARSGVNHIYFDLRKPLKSIEIINFTGSTGGAPGPWSYYGTNDPDDASSWKLLLINKAALTVQIVEMQIPLLMQIKLIDTYVWRLPAIWNSDELWH